MNLRKFENLIDALDKLRSLSPEVPLIVEGKNDEKALRSMGVCGEILKVQTSPSIVEFCESIASNYNEVILFTDLDSKGKKIGANVKKYLTDKGVKVEHTIAKKIMYTLDTVEAENIAKRFDKVVRKFNYP